MTYMELSPAGREIENLVGDGATIVRRGRRIESIGAQMKRSADVLEDLVAGEDGQKGKAIEKIREIVGDTYVELRRAGDMYEPTGPVLVAYGDAVSRLQPLFRLAVDTCTESWGDYVAAPGSRDGRPIPPADPAEAEDAAEEDAAKQEHYESWQGDARVFDDLYDDWEDAFNTAVDGIGDVLDGSIEDSFWDDVDGFVAGVLQVLQVVGIIIAIASIIIGGPIIALIGAVIGVLTLALTLYQYIRGDTGLTQLILAIVGVIPFGSAGKLFQGSSGRLAFLGDMFTAFKPSAWTDAIAQGRNLTLVSRFAGGGLSGFAAAGREFLTMSNPNGVGDVMARLMFGKDVGGMQTMIDAMSGAANGFCRSTTIAAGFQFAYTIVSGSWKLGDSIATWTGNRGEGPSGSLPWVGAVL